MRSRIALPVALVVLIAGLAIADETDLVARALDAKSPSGADGVLVLDDKTITLAKDGRVRTRIKQVQRFLTDEGMDVYGDPFFPFNADCQEVDVKTARTTRADGEKVDFTPNALTPITPMAVTKAHWYADMQDMVVALLGLEIGCASELEVSVKDKKPYRKLFYGSEPLHDGRDVVKRRIRIRVPSDRKIAWFAPGVKVEPEVKKDGDTREYTFRFEDVAAVSQHEAHGPAGGLAPVLYWMEKTGSAKLARRLLSAAPYALDKKKADEEADAIISVLEQEFADEMWGPVEEALGIHRRVADDIATVLVDRAVFGDGTRGPRKAFLSGYADPTEKLGILHTVFSRLGYDPLPLVLLHHDPGGSRRLHPHNVKGLWLRIAVQGRLLYLDAASTSGTGEPRDGHVFELTPTGLEEAPFVRPATTRMRLDAVVDLGADEPVVKGTATLRGAFNPYWSLFTSGGGCPSETVASLLGPSSGMEVSSATFVRLALDETIVAFTAKPLIEDGVLDVTLPSRIASVVESWELWRPDRTMPIEVKEKKWEKVRVEVRLPEGAKVLHAPVFAKTTRKSGPVSIFHSTGLDAKHVSLARRVTIKPGAVKPKKTDAIKELLADALNPNQNRIVVKLPSKK
jgi:hypothetical protein